MPCLASFFTFPMQVHMNFHIHIGAPLYRKFYGYVAHQRSEITIQKITSNKHVYMHACIVYTNMHSCIRRNIHIIMMKLRYTQTDTYTRTYSAILKYLRCAALSFLMHMHTHTHAHARMHIHTQLTEEHIHIYKELIFSH